MPNSSSSSSSSSSFSFSDASERRYLTREGAVEAMAEGHEEGGEFIFTWGLRTIMEVLSLTAGEVLTHASISPEIDSDVVATTRDAAGNVVPLWDRYQVSWPAEDTFC